MRFFLENKLAETMISRTLCTITYKQIMTEFSITVWSAFFICFFTHIHVLCLFVVFFLHILFVFWILVEVRITLCFLLVNSLAKKVMFLVALVCLFVCLSVSNIAQKIMNGVQWNFMEGSGVVKEPAINFGGELCLRRINEHNSCSISWSRCM